MSLGKFFKGQNAVVIGGVFTVIVAMITIVPSMCSRGPESSAVSVESTNQQGGQTAQTINNNIRIERPIAGPTFKLIAQESLNVLVEEKYISKFRVQCDYEVPPQNIYFEVRAVGVEGVRAAPQIAGTVMVGHSGKRENLAFTNLQTPAKEIVLEIESSVPLEPREKEKFQIIYDFK